MSGILQSSGDIDSTLKTGRATTEYSQIDGANTNAGAVSIDRTIASGDVHFHGRMEIGNGRTWTIDSGGSLVSGLDLTVTGTGVLLVNGTAGAT